MPAIDLTPPGICDPMPLPPLPPLPTGISFSVGLPGPDLSVRLCCKIFQLPNGLSPPISLGLGVVLPLAVTINAMTSQINKYLRALPMRCPREL